MKSRIIYIVAGIGLLLILLILLGGNSLRSRHEQSTDMIGATFSAKDKSAGGAYAAFKFIPKLFAGAAVQVVTKPFAATYKRERELQYAGNAYILVADQLFTTARDIDAMLDYVLPGNNLFIAVNIPDTLLGNKLNYHVTEEENQQHRRNITAQGYKDADIPVDTTFSYRGMISGSYFSDTDTTTTTVLGTNSKGKPNFIRVSYNKGFVYILLNPYTFCNYFLLEKNNVAALETQLSYLPFDATNIYWDDFYSNQHSAQSGSFSEWQVLLRYPAMRWALWLSVALLLLYVIFESKRRQRIIPDIAPLTNSSLEFVDAMGQLYYQQHNNYNLAHKMIMHLLEHIRTHFYLNTNQLNEQFAEALSRKAAIPEDQVRELLQQMHQIRLDGEVSDEALKELYKRIQLFYLNTK